MSNVSIVYDAILARLGVLFPTKYRIPKTNNLENNNANLMRNAYGIKVDSVSLEPSEFCNYAYSVNIGVILSEEIVATDSQYEQEDTAAKNLLEDMNTVIKDFIASNQINIEANVEKIDFVSCNGVESIVGTKNNFVYIKPIFNFYIRENL